MRWRASWNVEDDDNEDCGAADYDHLTPMTPQSRLTCLSVCSPEASHLQDLHHMTKNPSQHNSTTKTSVGPLRATPTPLPPSSTPLHTLHHSSSPFHLFLFSPGILWSSASRDGGGGV
ncbi:hypothetical protein E2C01_026262 [Portunus trituberculatus]|uniref:Uncharacterized protein n=1 Tax=Portunus trituberculatus TaxID=210409 RepID=A0A5B7EHM5_PORTR|nr:hypothetical protein [Portunus trituberculatus]